ncbi:MAG: isoprenylcysteine carboxylmethyltransferase family protein [Pseudolabrys sp.]
MNIATQHETGPGTAGAIVRPPLLFLTAILLGFVTDHLVPLTFPIARTGDAHWISAAFAACLVAAGLVIFASAVRSFAGAGTPVQGTMPTRTLVTTGIYGWSRNPIYLGMFLFYIGIGIVVRSPWIMILTLPLAITVRYGVIAREEAYLELLFGEVYRDYRTRVRRWL